MFIRNLIFGTILLAASACGADNGRPTDEAVQSPSIKMYALDCGSIIMPANALDSSDSFSDDELRYLVVPCFLIRHPKGDFMWDAGLSDALHENPQIAPMLKSWVERPMADQLAEIGVPPEDVEYLAVSHSHFDHAGNAPLFKNAKWVVMQSELSFSSSEFARGLGFVLNMAESETEKIIIDDEYDVFGDGSVIVFPTPGHTAGHLSMLLKLPESGAFIFSGDLYHMQESRERQLVPDFNFDHDLTRESMARFERMAETHDATVIIQHVRRDFERFPRFPAYSE